MRAFWIGVLLGPWIWASVFWPLFGAWKLARALRDWWFEWCIRHSEGAAGPQPAEVMPPAHTDRHARDELHVPSVPVTPAPSDAALIRAVFEDIDLAELYPWLTDEQRHAVLQSRHREARR